MKRTERHIIKNSSDFDSLCLKAKNLYNRANYEVRQLFIKSSKLGEYLRTCCDDSETYCPKCLKNHTSDDRTCEKCGKKLVTVRKSSGWYLNFYETDRTAKKQKWPEYKALPAQTSQQILKLLDKSWKSFFEANKEYQKNPGKFPGRPKMPGYKDREGRAAAVFTNQQCRIKDGFICFPKTLKLRPVKTGITGRLCEVRIIPESTCHVVEAVYEKETVPAENLNRNYYLGIDIGISNLATLTSNIPGLKPLILDGKPVKSANQYYNKEKARLMSFIRDRGTSKRIEQLTHKRNCKIEDFMHKTSKQIVEHCIENRIGNIVIGKNDGWKQKVGLGKKTNQKFTGIPFEKMIRKVEYKAEEAGISVMKTEENHTSRCSFYDSEPIQHRKEYTGKRVKRGLFRTGSGRHVNADVNGSLNIIRKAVPDAFANGTEGIGFCPSKRNPLSKDTVKNGNNCVNRKIAVKCIYYRVYPESSP